MTSAQVWTALGIFVGAFASLITLTLMIVSSKFDTLSTKIDRLSAKVDIRFDGTDKRIDLLDRDVQKLVEKVFGS